MKKPVSKQSAAMDKVQKAVEAGKMTAYAAASHYSITTAAIYKSRWYRAMKAKEAEAKGDKDGAR